MKTANGQQVVFSLDLHYIQVKDLDQIHCLGFLDLSKFVSKYVSFSVFAASIQNKTQKNFFCDVWMGKKAQIHSAHQKEGIDRTKKVPLAAKKSSARD